MVALCWDDEREVAGSLADRDKTPSRNLRSHALFLSNTLSLRNNNLI
jgi:hypothetical protein